MAYTAKSSVSHRSVHNTFPILNLFTSVTMPAVSSIVNEELTKDLLSAEEVSCQVGEDEDECMPDDELLEDDDGLPCMNETLDEMKKYVNDDFVGVNVTQWKMDDMFCHRVCLNGAETDLLKMTHTLLDKCAQKAAQECGKSVIDINEIDCVNMFLPIQWYWLLQNEINKNYPAIKDKCTCQEILEMTKIWILQFIYRTTSTRIFSEPE